jgi:hypothetical protein
MCLDLVNILDRLGVSHLASIIHQDMNWLGLLFCLAFFLLPLQVLLYGSRKVFDRRPGAQVQLQARQFGRRVDFLNGFLGRLTSGYTSTRHYNVEVLELRHVLDRSLSKDER